MRKKKKKKRRARVRTTIEPANNKVNRRMSVYTPCHLTDVHLVSLSLSVFFSVMSLESTHAFT